jgi:hypothetical protein
MIKHTDLPWHIEPHGFGGYYIMKENGDTALGNINDPGNAAFIVNACNVHQELLDFIKDLRPFLGYDPEATLHKRADALIAKAVGSLGG